jgi:hypothetical protein
MKQFWTLLAVCAGLLALPTAASAQSAVPPPRGDNFSDFIAVTPSNSVFLPLTPAVLGFSGDTSSYTLEPADGAPTCGSSAFGKNIWSRFAVDRTGRIDITAAGFDSVIGVSPLNAQGETVGGICTDRLAGRIESFPRDNLPTVKKGTAYAVQVGGFRDQAGNFAGGPLEVDFEFLPPERVQGDAILTWRSTRGGIKVTSVKVDGPRGSGAAIGCIRKRCGKTQTISNPKAQKGLARLSHKVIPGGAAKFVPAARDKSEVRLATTSAFRGRKIPNGARLLVVVLAEDQIGQAFFWDVKNNAAGAKTLGCVEPEGTRVQRSGTCDGK